MKHATVYLAGPILDMRKGEANDWREEVTKALAWHNVVGISPLRCEPLVGDPYTAGTACPKFGTAKAIGSKNVFDVRKCDMILAYIPNPGEGRHHSWGTICEMSWAFALGKPAVLVSEDPDVRNHPVLNATAGWVVESLDDGVEIIAGILGDYSEHSLKAKTLKAESVAGRTELLP